MRHLRGGEDLRNTSEGMHFWTHQVPATQSSWRSTLSWPRTSAKPVNTTALPPCTCAGRSRLPVLPGSVAETQCLLHVPCKGDKVQMGWGQHKGQQIDNVVQVYRKKEIIQIEWVPHRKDNSTCSCEQWPHQAKTGQRVEKNSCMQGQIVTGWKRAKQRYERPYWENAGLNIACCATTV